MRRKRANAFVEGSSRAVRAERRKALRSLNSRWLITGLLAAVGLAALLAVGVQRKELLRLRSEQQQFLARLDTAAPTSQGDNHAANSNSPDDNAAISELLRLRAEVTRLAAQKRGLAGVLVE